MHNPETLKSTIIHHTVYSCLSHCARKYQETCEIILNM
jgi:hypothetical protein